MGFLAKLNLPRIRPLPVAEAPPQGAVKAILRHRASVSAEEKAPAEFAEIRRICGLEVVSPLTDEEHEAANKDVVLAKPFDEGWRLWHPQTNGLQTYLATHGLFGPVGVGWGKQLLCDLIAEAAYRKGLKKILLLVPSEVYGQVWDRDIPWARRHCRITVPFHGLGRRSASTRLGMSRTCGKGVYVLPYSCLSVKNTTEVLNAIAAELIIADEADNLRNRGSAKTKRIAAYMAESELAGLLVEFVALSGTITRKRIRDYWHLLKWCLKEGCPLPLSTTLADQWAETIDAAAGVDTGGVLSVSQAGPIQPLVDWARRYFKTEIDQDGNTVPLKLTDDVAGFRKAYRLRLTSAPGVVATSDNEIGVSLVIANAPVPDHEQHKDWATLKKLIDQADPQVGLMLTPNGDTIEHAIHAYKWLYELSAGFYNEQTWPTVEVVAERRKISLDQATEVRERSLDQHSADQVYARLLRKWLEDYSEAGRDTPLGVHNHLQDHGPENLRCAHELYAAWLDKEKLKFDGILLRDKKAVRVCDYKVRHAVEWAKSLPVGEGGILWVYNPEVGRWVYEELRLAGVDTLHCPAGDEYNAILTEPDNPEASRVWRRNVATKVVVASIKGHGVGKNLQAFSHQFFLQWWRDASKTEQALGRLHRNGQKADMLIAITNHTTKFDKMCMSACLTDSLYIHQTTGVRQKLIYCNYDPLPEIFPDEVLREKGFQNQRLTADQRRMLLDKFRPNI